MDKPANESLIPPPITTNGIDLRSPEQKPPRRRFVQSTLFPIKSHENKIDNSVTKTAKTVGEINVIDCDDDDDVVECCGSQEAGKKKRGRKPNLNSNSTPKKGRPKKVADIGKDVDYDIDDDDVVEPCGSLGEKKKRGRKPKLNSTPRKGRPRKVAADSGKNDCLVSIDDTESPDDGSPLQLKEKQHTPTRKGRASGIKRTSTSKTPPRQVSAQQVPQTVPDLWQEAKKTAEENSRIFAGKQIHPFFSSWKAGKKNQEIIEVESDECVDKRKERNAEFNPIHVFEVDKDNVDFNDWSNWTFFDGPLSNNCCNQATTISAVEDTAVSNPCGTSPRYIDVSSSQYYGPYKQTLVITMPVSPALVDEDVTPIGVNQKLVKRIEENELFISSADGQLNSDILPQAFLQDRMISHYRSRSNQPENSLWTNKYQPEKASEVCGNSEAVKFVNDWLRLWHAADFRVRKKSHKADNFVVDDEYDSDASDSYAENEDEPPNLKNVLLVSGPVGSGKSAAIYACAKEQGFEVIEVNASDWRSGAILKQKFGEAVGLHWLKRSQETHVGSQRKLDFNSSPAAPRHEVHTLDLNSDAVEEISLSEEEAIGGAGTQKDGDGRLCTDQAEIKTLLLFEDVDATLCEDRGFISTIQQLADIGKRPMILTSNNENPELPNNLDREEITFTIPSLKEMIHHISLVCAAEKAYVQPHLIERCIDFCGGDIRKSLMHLQFWCQQKRCIKDGKKQSMNSPLMLSLAAMHSTLPKLIPWGIPSSLSEFIEAETAQALCSAKEDQCWLDTLEEDEGNVLYEFDFDKDAVGIIEAKKEAILRENCFLHVNDDNIPVSSLCDTSNCSGSPIAFNRRNTRRRLDIVFSDSEEELPSHEKPAVSNGLFHRINHDLLPTVDSHFPIPIPVLEDTSKECGDHLLNYGATEVEETNHHLSEAVDVNHIYSFPVSNSTDLFVHSAAANFPENKYHSRQLLDLNNSCCEEPRDSYNQFNEEILSMGIAKNSVSDQPIHFGKVKVAETEFRIAANHCLNPSSDQLQQCVLANTITEGLVHRREATKTKFQNSGKRSQELANDSLNQLFEQSSSCVVATMENIQHQQSAFTCLNPSSYQNLDVSSNSLNHHMSHAEEAKGKGIWHQYSEAGEQTLKFCTTMGGHSSQSNGQYFRPAISEEIQLRQQHSGSDYVNCSLSILPDVTLKQSQQTETKSSFHQSLKMSNINFAGCLADGNSMSPLSGKALKCNETKSEEQQRQYSYATDVNRIDDRCGSVDVSCVPESTFVPETEVNDGTETPVGMDMMDIVSPATFIDADTSVLRLGVPETSQADIDINVSLRSEDLGDSQSDSEHHEASTSGRQVMDECSRMGFCKKPKRLRSFRSELKFPVQEKWNELRFADLRQYCVSEHEYSLQMLDLAFGVSNHISDGDLLLRDCDFLINDSCNQHAGLSEETFTFGWHDQQIHMASVIAEHGYCLYTKDINELQLKMGIYYPPHLDWELLTSTNNAVTLGTLLRLNRSKSHSLDQESTAVGQTIDSSHTRVRETCLTNIVQSIAPLKSYLALKGNALHDYLSSLAHISRSEASRLAEREAAQKTKRRRVRATKNYLSSGALDLSPDDILLLNKYNSYSKISS